MSRQFVSFRLQRQLIGLDILHVREINRELECTPVQLAEPHIIGLSNLRGQIVTIFDLARRIGLSVGRSTVARHDVVLKAEAELEPIRAREQRLDLIGVPDAVGLRVGDIGEIVEVDETELQPVPANLTHLNRALLASIAALERELLVVLDVPALVGVGASSGSRPVNPNIQRL